MSSSGKVSGWVVTPSIVSVICLAPPNIALIDFSHSDKPQPKITQVQPSTAFSKFHVYGSVDYWNSRRGNFRTKSVNQDSR